VVEALKGKKLLDPATDRSWHQPLEEQILYREGEALVQGGKR
jgi:hypothetical protein